MTQSLTKAVLLTGAAARISQEVAMLDQLMDWKEPPVNGLPLTLSQDDTLLAGFSSGSLNLAAINACFSSGSQLGWDTYYKQQVLFPLRNKDVYKINLPLQIPLLSTDPLRVTLTNFLAAMNCKEPKDLPFYSYILTCSLPSLRKRKTMWLCSQTEEDYDLNLADVFMSSTAIPIVFPSQRIHYFDNPSQLFPGYPFVDGGTLGTFDQFGNNLGEYVNQNQPFETLYIISPMREKAEVERIALRNYLEEINMEISKERKILVRIEEDMMVKIVENMENVSLNTFLKFLTALNNWRSNDNQPMATNIYVSIPSMAENFGILNFNKEQEQYQAVLDWGADHKDKIAVPIQQYIDEHQVDLV
jgi:hypothetical protein